MILNCSNWWATSVRILQAKYIYPHPIQSDRQTQSNCMSYIKFVQIGNLVDVSVSRSQ